MKLNPCVESLKDMKPVDGGRYCGSCAKTIVDLTNKSNQEIRQMYDDHDGKLCGIVKPNQLQENKFYHPLKRFALSLIIVFGTSLFVFANTNGFNQFRNNAYSQLKQADVKLTINGYIFGGGNPLVGAEVVAIINGVDYIGYSDINGEYKIDVPVEYYGDIKVRFQYAGYESVTKDFHVKDGMTKLFAGRVNLDKSLENCVKGKVAIDPTTEQPEIYHTAGIVVEEDSTIVEPIEIMGDIAPPEPEEFEHKGGEIIAPEPPMDKGNIVPVENPENVIPAAGGIEAPEIHEKGDIDIDHGDNLKFD